jgi:hypothetical protein
MGSRVQAVAVHEPRAAPDLGGGWERCAAWASWSLHWFTATVSGMSVIASASSPIPRVAWRDGVVSADVERTVPSGQGLFEASAGLLAAARALAANADAPDSRVALGPALACMEASLEALAEAARRIGDEYAADRASRARLDRLAEALVAAAGGCSDARRTTSASD